MARSRRAADAQAERKLRTGIYGAIAAGEMSIGQAVAAMRHMSKLTQPEFAQHRGLSVQSLRAIETDNGNPTVETLDKVATIFGLQVGFVPKSKKRVSWRELERLAAAAGHLPDMPVAAAKE